MWELSTCIKEHPTHSCQCPRHASSSGCPVCLLRALSLPGAHYCLGTERLWLAWVIVARGFRETLEILFRFSKKPASITVKVANPLSGRGRASVCPWPLQEGTRKHWCCIVPFQCLTGKNPHPSDGNAVTLMVGTLSGIARKHLGTRLASHLPVP